MSDQLPNFKYNNTSHSLRKQSNANYGQESSKTIQALDQDLSKIFEDDLGTRRENQSGQRKCRLCTLSCICNDKRSTLCSKNIGKLSQTIKFNKRQSCKDLVKGSKKRIVRHQPQIQGINKELIQNALIRFRSKSAAKSHEKAQFISKRRLENLNFDSDTSSFCVADSMLNDGVKTPILASAKNIGELQSDDSLIEAPLCNRRYNQGRKFGQSNHSLPRLLLRQEAISEICGRTSSGITKNLLKNSPIKHNKMPLPLYPKKKNPILEKIKSEEVGFSPLQNFSNEKGSCVTKNGILKKKLSSKDRRSLYKNLCKGTSVSNDCDQDQSPDHKSTSGKVTSNLSTYKPCSSDDTVGHFSAQKFGKLPKLSSPEMKLKLMKMAQNSMKRLPGNGAVPSAAQISPKKNCQNERFPKYKFSMSTKASSQKEVSSCKSIPKIPELQEKTLKDSKELDYKKFDSLDDALLEIPDEENDTFKLDETLGSLFTMERDEVLSVSDDSVLSEITQKSKKKHIVIKMKKKCDRKCLK